MTGAILHGAPVADRILTDLATRTTSLRARGIHPHLVFVMLDSAVDAQLYARRLEKITARTGIEVSRRQLTNEISLDDLDREVAALNADSQVDGIIVQMPLPPHLTYEDLSSIIDPRKDVDGISIENAGRLYLGIGGHAASTGVAMLEILHHAGIDPAGQHAVVIGRSQVVGHPIAELLLHRDATLTVTHRQTRDLPSYTRQADILLVGAGEPHLVKPHMIKSGVTIIDAGINLVGDRIVGDVDFDGCLPFCQAITPVPGGVGPVTNAVLLRHLVESAERRPG